MKLAFVLLLILGFGAAPAQELPAEPGRDFSPRATEGSFDLVVRVDGEVIVYVQETRIRYLLLSGAPPANAGSNYTQPIPRARYGSFNLERIAGRGSVDLVEEPSPANDYTAVVRIHDRNSGADLYHVRLDWTWNPADPSRPPGGGSARPLDSRINDPADYNRDREGGMEFRGSVDGVTALYVRSDQVRTEVISGRTLRGDRFRFSQPLPSRRPAAIELVDVRGRGHVELVERPWEGNGYTAVVRIED